MKHCVFLRGVNVKGTSMKMAEVVEVFKNVGMQNVISVLATGNIIFESEKDSGELKNILEKAMSEHFSYEAFLFLKTNSEVEKIYADCPFHKKEDSHIYVFVGSDGIDEILLQEFEKSKKSTNEDAKIVNSTFYWQVEKGNTLDSDFGKILGRKNLKDALTSRNLNTFEKIMKKL
jgi:uncharacterized protein (DUF1697 family)